MTDKRLTGQNPSAPAIPERYRNIIEQMKNGHHRIAEEKCRALLADMPLDTDAMTLLASALVAQGQHEEAEQLLRQSLKLSSGDPSAWNNLGRFLQTAGRWQEAEDHYRRASELFPSHPGFAVTLGQIYQRASRFEDAEQEYRRALENAPNGPIHVQLGMVLLRQERIDEAIAAFQTAISINPKLPAAYGNLGNAEQKRGNLTAAEAAYDRAVVLNPQDLTSYVSLGIVRLKLGAAREAAEMFERALSRQGSERRAAAWLPFARAQEFGDMPGGYRAEMASLVSRHTLEAPENYASLTELNKALAEALLADISLEWEPRGKATRKGQQTGLLLDLPREPFISFEKILRKEIDAHFDRMTPEPRHPYRGQIPKDYHLSLWGTVLSEGGHQHSHIHAGGWMSGVYYVSLPPHIGTGDENQDGWIEFGHPPPEFDANFEPKTISYEPKAGDALFFPSYLFHRTLPFSSDVPRISLAFDVKPTSWR